MSRHDALIGSAVFFLLAPGIVGGLTPWWITRWRFGVDASATLMIVGGLMIALAAAALIACFVRFAFEGEGTPAPLAPTRQLVTGGLYAHVRNPMYLAVAGMIFGQALVFASAALIAYGVAVTTAFVLFVLYYEEPRLRTEFPEQYPSYFDNVPRWIPRLKGWRAPEPAKDAEGSNSASLPG